jgi:hypothetical protein
MKRELMTRENKAICLLKFLKTKCKHTKTFKDKVFKAQFTGEVITPHPGGKKCAFYCL